MKEINREGYLSVLSYVMAGDRMTLIENLIPADTDKSAVKAAEAKLREVLTESAGRQELRS